MTEYVVLDTNVLLFESRLLRTPLSARFLKVLHQRKAMLVLAEVVEAEVYEIAKRHAADLQATMLKAEIGLNRLLGYDPSASMVPLVDEAAVEKAVRDRLRELDEVIVARSMKLEHARRSLNRAVKGRPPSSRDDEQFRDSLIFDVALDCSDECPTFLVTRDGGFYEGAKGHRRIASSLQAEVGHRQLFVVQHLSDYLAHVGEEPNVELPEVCLSALGKGILRSVNLEWIGQGLWVDHVAEVEPIAVASSEQPGVLAVQFRAELDGVFVDPAGAHNGPISAEVEGEALIRQNDASLQDIELVAIQLDGYPQLQVSNLAWIAGLRDRRDLPKMKGRWHGA